MTDKRHLGSNIWPKSFYQDTNTEEIEVKKTQSLATIFTKSKCQGSLLCKL